MKRQAREVYGYGAGVRTAEDRAAKLARALLAAFVTAAMLGYALVAAGVLEAW